MKKDAGMTTTQAIFEHDVFHPRNGLDRPKGFHVLLEFALAQGSMPGTTICGLADGTNGVVKTILQKFPDNFKKHIRSDTVQGVELAVRGVPI